tara:strand:- start:469 stop:1191 length:723 start_codon:yes stop_codon:yes gene_type:complete
MGIDPDAFHFIFGEDGFDTLDIPQLERLILEENFNVIMLDSVTTLIGNKGVSMNDPKFSSPLYELNKLASRRRVLIIITSHLRKPLHQKRTGVSMFDILGTGTQAGSVNDVWGLWRKEDTTQKELRFVLSCLDKARNCKAGTTWNLKGDIEDFSWRFESIANEKELLPSIKKKLSTRAEELLCETDEWKTIEEIANYFDKNKEVTRDVLMDLFIREKVERKKQQLGLRVGGRPKWLYRGK